LDVSIKDSISQTPYAACFGTMVTAEEKVSSLEPVSNDTTVTILADWCQSLNGAFKTVKKVRLSILQDFEALVVSVTASLTCFHTLDAP